MNALLAMNSAPPDSPWRGYLETLRLAHQSSLLRNAVPIEYSRSLLLPTRRWDRPGYAGFANAASRAEERPVKEAPPDRWWLFSAEAPRLLAFVSTSVIPFADRPLETVSVDRAGTDIAALDEAWQRFAEAMEPLAAAFFDGEDVASVGDAAEVALDAFDSLVVEDLRPRYVALAPDFLSWLAPHRFDN